jgi:hypothetical protein
LHKGGNAVLEAIDSELSNILKKDVMKYEKLSDFKGIKSLKDLEPRPIPSLLDIKEKFDAFGNFIKWKARFCAGGHRQNRMNYTDDEITSPCIMLETIFVIIAFSALWDANAIVIDIGQAYLEAALDPDDIVYM